ncbi:hypothetical protein [Pseudomonas sp. MWU12-2345]|uniref:hypothetical protein n=1 Tax=Pseudomonas sp. MWU12-2345 TaxID=2928689 RepID=UPI00201083C3|nr:hypothetical protein [Pseudomonas sp. MWU12-2345]
MISAKALDRNRVCLIAEQTGVRFKDSHNRPQATPRKACTVIAKYMNVEVGKASGSAANE